MIIQYRDIPAIKSLVFRGPGSLVIRQSDVESLRIEAAGNHLDQIQSNVKDSELQLGLREMALVDLSAYQGHIKYHLSVNELNSIQIRGICSVSIPDTDWDELSLRISGRAKIEAENLTADYLRVIASDNASLRVGGDVERQFVQLSDHAELQGEHLVCDSAELRMTGDTLAQVRANDHLDAYISERSRLTYMGYPDVHKLGAGKIERRRKQTTTRRGKEHG